ncbi:MAG: hypothetical protein A3K76_02590 [Euryarchaeota archaeon RBG_13_57_23]|nr:MAG: hypothetical protein A3K76_02590 [Euryarchaeota archaeon RBG_13_57_23]
MTDHDKRNVVKILAIMMRTAPGLTIRTGWVYFKAKRKMRRSHRILTKELVKGGIPEDFAKKLADGYAANLRIRNLVRRLSGGRFGFRR